MVGTLPPAMRPEAAAGPSVSSVAAGAEAAVGAASATGGMPLSAEDEASIKSNTDCVYFLASPLTCKKGSECEYRHSDYARMNPRDCWYWLNGNCLNPKCPFRHPPLDGLLGTQMPNPVGTPASQPVITPTAPAPGSFAAGKQGVACIFFQKGNCLKGDWCPFSHGSNPASNKVPQTQAAVPTTEPAMFKKTFGLEKFSQEKKAPHVNNLKPVELTNQTSLINKFESAPAKQDFSSKKFFYPSSGTVDDPHRNRPADTRLPNDGSRVNIPNRVQQPLQVNRHAVTLNVKDAEEVSRDPSPGFDVLVDNEHGDSDYYHNEDQFVRARDHEGLIEYFDGQSGDYSARVDADRDLYRDSRAYDSYERPQGRYANEQHRSSKSMSDGLGHQERRRYGRDSPDLGDHSDLRDRLSKHRRSNGLRSAVNHDSARERPDERRHQVSQWDLGRDRERQEPSLSGRLRGRIIIPATDGNDQRLNNRDVERGREYSGRLSPGRSQVSSRMRDRIKGLVQDGSNNDGRIGRGPHMRRDTVSDNNSSSFSGPRSLSELKSQKNADGHDQHVTGKRKYMKSDYQQYTVDNLSFEGPKPLEEILKRKRGAGTAGFEGNNSRSNIQERNEETLDITSSNIRSNISLHKNEDYKSGDVKSVSKALADDQSVPHPTNDAELEDGMIVEDGGEDQDPEAYEQGDEEFDYEQGDEDNYNLDENEIGDGEEEEYPDEDDDEFAKKMGVLY